MWDIYHRPVFQFAIQLWKPFELTNLAHLMFFKLKLQKCLKLHLKRYFIIFRKFNYTFWNTYWILYICQAHFVTAATICLIPELFFVSDISQNWMCRSKSSRYLYPRRSFCLFARTAFLPRERWSWCYWESWWKCYIFSGNIYSL